MFFYLKNAEKCSGKFMVILVKFAKKDFFYTNLLNDSKFFRIFSVFFIFFYKIKNSLTLNIN